ncbi:rod-binding protein [Mesorhizobium sp. 1B3]|uniref:rod-binding protein n=1 Tax=Mesorhizobium sp. 1B3 TaxID=3243599 RepID=UPI003D993DC1
MAISPPSDIVLDVAQAVGKPDLDAARARLADASAARRSGGAAFSLTEGSSREAEKPARPAGKAYVQFEAMVLRNFMETMLPKENEAVYGKGLAGDMWKSLMAEQLANVVAERGGIGISDRVLGDYYMDGESQVPVAGVSQGPKHEALNTQNMLSQALVQEIQRNVIMGNQQDRMPDLPGKDS